MQLHSCLRQIFHVDHVAASALAQRHNSADIVLRRHDFSRNDWLLYPLYLRRIRQVGRVLNHNLAAVLHNYLVYNARQGGDDIEVKFPLKSLDYNVHVQQPEEAATVSEAEGRGIFRLEVECSIVDLQLLERVLYIFILLTICRIHSAVHHGLRLLVSLERMSRLRLGKCDGVSDSGIGNLLDTGAHVAYLSCLELLGRNHTRNTVADFSHLVVLAGVHHADVIALLYSTVKYSRVYHHTLVAVVI